MTIRRTLAAVLSTALLCGATAPVFGAEFSDVPSGHWARAAIAGCEARGIISGYSDGSFRPSGTVSNAQFLVMLTRAFYPEAVAKYAAMEWAQYEAWWWPNWRAALEEQLTVLTDLTGVEAFQQKANQPITRQNMAQILWNVLKAKGFTVSEDQRKTVREEISDWRAIHVVNREGVASVYALGVIGGLSDGTFGGGSYMNRAQGCTVIERVRKLIAAGPSAPAASVQPPSVSAPSSTVKTPAAPSQPAVSPAPTPAAPNQTQTPAAPSQVQKPSEPVQTQTPSEPEQTPSVPETSPGVVNQEPDPPPSYSEEPSAPVLANGAEITEENVLAILEELKKQYPDGMEWNGQTSRTGVPSQALDGTIKRSYFHHLGGHVSMVWGCGGFASLLSDAVFGGGSANPARKLDSLADIRPGDILMKLDANGRVTHMAIAAARPSETTQFHGVTAYRAAVRGGSGNDMVYSFVSILPAQVANGFYYEAWTRYPA